jgi:hypothetical protein
MAVIGLAPNATRPAVAAQHDHSQTGTSAAPHLEADGSKNPDLVSDYHAYRQFIVAASLRDNAPVAGRKRRQAFIKRIGLSPRDEALLMAALRNVPERLVTITARREAQGATTSTSMRVALREQEEKVFDGANRRIRSLLSRDGWLRLDDFVQKMKRQIKVYTNE